MSYTAGIRGGLNTFVGIPCQRVLITVKVFFFLRSYMKNAEVPLFMKTHTSEWKTQYIFNNGVKFTIPTLKKQALDFGLATAGAVVFYGVGMGLGEIMDHVPYLNTYIPRAIEYFTDINVSGNLDGLGALVGGITGFTRSGSKTFAANPERLEDLTVGYVTLTLKK